MEESQKHTGLIIENAKRSKFIEERSETNGHDCWGNLEWTTEYFVHIEGKREGVFDGDYLIHDGNKILDCCKESRLAASLQRIVEKREYEERLEKAKAELIEAEKKFSSLPYSEKLKFQIEGIKKKHPKLEKIFETVRRICAKSTMEYDYEVERTYEMYNEVAKILETA